MMGRPFLYILLIALSFLLSQNLLLAQKEGFNKVYRIPHKAGRIGKTVLELDSTYLIQGGVDTNLLTPNGRGLVLIRLDKTGDTLQSSMFGEDAQGNYWAGNFENIIESSDSGFFMVGSYENPNGSFKALLYRMNEKLDTLWTRSYGTSDTLREKFSSIEPLPDGNYLIAGQKEDDAYGHRAWLLKITSQGDVLWERLYGNNKDENFNVNSLQRTHDGGFITGGIVSENTSGQGKKFASGLVIKLDSMGNKEWQRTFMGNYGYWVSGIHQTSDSTYMVGGGKSTDVVQNLGNPDGQVGMMRKYSEDGDLLWEELHYPDTSAPHHATDGYVKYMTPGSDNSWILTGLKALSPIQNPDSIEEGWIYKTNSNGGLLWMRSFRHHDIGENVLWNVREVEKKRILAIGKSEHPNTTNQRGDIWLLKLDSMGCVTSGCAVSIEEQQKRPTSGFSVRPNPNEGRFRVRSAREEGRYRGTLSVRDAQGRLLYQRRLEGQYPFEKRVGLPEASPGVHFVAWKDRNGRYVRKVVVR